MFCRTLLMFGHQLLIKFSQDTLTILSCLFSLNGSHDAALVFAGTELKIPNALPSSCSLKVCQSHNGFRRL